MRTQARFWFGYLDTGDPTTSSLIVYDSLINRNAHLDVVSAMKFVKAIAHAIFQIAK